jgi:type II secretory pathway component PulK
MRTRCDNPSSDSRQGFVLVAVLVVVTLLALAAYEFSDLMLAEYRAAVSYRRAVQARAAAESGINYAAALLSDPGSFQNVLGGNPYNNPGAFQDILVQDDDLAINRTHFSIVAPVGGLSTQAVGGTTTPYQFGVVDETGKINLNAMMMVDSSGQKLYNFLMLLPNMTDEVANSILNWIDPNPANQANRSSGATDQDYMALQPPYHCKSGPLDSLEELLLVQGVTPQLLYGNDANRNGIFDPNEDDGSGTFNPGWSAYLTVYSREQNVDSNGNPRVYINDTDLNNLETNLTNAGLSQDLVLFILAYRQYGPSANPSGGPGGQGGAMAGNKGAGGNTGAKPGQGGGGDTDDKGGAMGGSSGGRSGGGATGGGAMGGGGAMAGGAAGGAMAGRLGGGGMGGGMGGGSGRLTRGAINFQQRGQPKSIGSLYSLINATVSIPSQQPGGQPQVYTSPLSDPSQLQQQLPLLLDETTTTQDSELPARINVNSATQPVLYALEALGLQDADVQNILSNQPQPGAMGGTGGTGAGGGTSGATLYNTPAWLMTQANLTAQQMQSLERYITARSQVYRVQSVGYIEGGLGPAVRLEAVIDTNGGQPRISYWRDLTELGRGFDPATFSQSGSQ